LKIGSLFFQKFNSIILGIFVLSFLLFSEWIQKSGVIIFPSGIRQALVLGYFIYLWKISTNIIVISKIYLVYIILLTLYVVLNFIISDVKILNYLAGFLFTFNFSIIFIFSSNTKTSESVLIKLLHSLFYIILIFVFPPFIEGIVDGSSLRYHPGVFREAGALGTVINCGVTISLCLFIINKKKIYLIGAIFFTTVVFFTTLKKAIICDLVIWSFYAWYFLSLKKFLKFFVYAFIFLFLVVVYLGNELLVDLYDNLDYLERAGESHVRYAMYLASFKIFSDFFPFGCGLGSFGSIPSLMGDYSIIYYKYGISNIEPLGPEIVRSGDTHMLFDTYWPHIIGELGLLGSIIYFLFWFYPLRNCFKIIRSNLVSDFLKSLSFFIITIIAVVTLEGFTLYTPEIPSFIFLYAGIVGLFYFHLNKVCIING
jgi:hypothetical protein